MPSDVPLGVKPGEALAGLLAKAGITSTSNILIAGRQGFPALLWLCRRGYANVGYVHAAARCCGEHADALLIAAICDPPTLEAALVHGGHLQEDGVVVFQCRVASSPFLLSVLSRHGFGLERRLHGVHRDLMIARRFSGAMANAA